MLTGSANNRVGLAKSFEVNPGDVFDLEVYTKYEEPLATPAGVNTLLSQLVSAFSLGEATSPLDGGAAYSAFENVFQGGGPWINSSMWDPAAPKAYLNYLLFDENFVLVDTGFDQVSTNCEQESDVKPGCSARLFVRPREGRTEGVFVCIFIQRTGRSDECVF